MTNFYTQVVDAAKANDVDGVWYLCTIAMSPHGHLRNCDQFTMAGDCDSMDCPSVPLDPLMVDAANKILADFIGGAWHPSKVKGA